MSASRFSATVALQRIFAIFYKELFHIRRDKMTFAMLIGIPLIQVMLFGFAINPDPKHLPTVFISTKSDEFSRMLAAGMENSQYFKISDSNVNRRELEHLIRAGKVMIAVDVPTDFARRLVRDEKPLLQVEVDATDPSSVNHAIHVLAQVTAQKLAEYARYHHLQYTPATEAIETRVLRRYNPEINIQRNIIPGLLGVILTMTLVLMTGLSITREKEKGTIEALLSTAVQPWQVMIGKILPYLAIGILQTLLVLCLAYYVFHVPFLGSLTLLIFCLLIFIAANLTLGITISIIAASQMQATQMTFFLFLPSILLSGFMFPFLGMPHWAQNLAEILPLTHFQRFARIIMLKGGDFWDVVDHLWPIMLFHIFIIIVGLLRYKRTLD